ncbi:unnamed protein product [Periconia digitata]|uniref:Uncharacterized protein n=1 Tax=Periconia digitata TaxID=1303443 RepID=A0A9W4UIT3_9PLEO|nr:unnamed protein product [Periconia digitata]
MIFSKSYAGVTAADLKDPTFKKPSRTGSWDRVIVYDPESGDLSRHRKSTVDEDHAYQKFEIPRGRRELSLFVDSETETRLKTDAEEQIGNYLFYAKLRFDKLGPVNHLLEIFGVLSLRNLYVSGLCRTEESKDEEQKHRF